MVYLSPSNRRRHLRLMHQLFSNNVRGAERQFASGRFEFTHLTSPTVCAAGTRNPRLPGAKARPIMQDSLMKLIVIFVVLSPWANAQSDFFPILHCQDRTYTNATIDNITPATVTVSWEGNGVTEAITNLPPKLQSRYHYNRRKAQKYLARQAAVKEAQQERDHQKATALAAAQDTLGPVQSIRIIKPLLFPGSLQIDADGVLSEANIPNLPPDILDFIQKLGQAQTDAANLKKLAQQARADADHARGIAQGMAWNDSGFAAQNAAANTAQDLARDAETKSTDAEALLHKLQDQVKDRTTIVARPTGQMITAHVRQWAFQSMASADLSDK